MPAYEVTESNSEAVSTLNGSVAPGTGAFSILGVSRAGWSEQNAGQAFFGTYGTLVLNTDGTFSYYLNNADPDTQVLGSGISALDRFTYTYMLNGAAARASLEFRVNGVDEPGQVVTNVTDPITYYADATIGALERLSSSAQSAITLGVEFGPSLNFINNGAILVSAPGYSSNGIGSGGFAPRHQFVNNGRLEVISHSMQASGGGATTVINNGVVRVFDDQVRNLNTGQPAGQARGVGGSHLINAGTIEASSVEGLAIAVNATWVENSGFIYASGNASLDWIRAIDIGASGALINNSGTIHAVSTGGGETIGIRIWPNGSNVHSYGTILNSGRIVADVAISAVEGYSTGIHVTNSGYIEGELRADKNLNIITNSTGGVWIGNLQLGLDPDIVLNAGVVTGNIDLGGGVNYFDGRGGTVNGLIYSSGAVNIMFGGSGADRLQGGFGIDRIEGGGGGDTLSGNGGTNIFAYSAVSDSTGSAFDTIVDFQTGVDKIDLGALAPTSVSFTPNGSFTDVTAVTANGTLVIRVNGTVVASDIISVQQTGDLTGSSAADLLFAITPNATLRGLDGNDVLYGGSGSNLMDGGTGADVMFGGAGNDIYYIDNDGDRALELDGGGTDTVLTRADFSLQAFIENGVLIEGAGAIGILGNALANNLQGNSADNLLRGGDGNDVIIGGAGSDAMEGGQGVDRFVYLSTSDSLYSRPDHIVDFDHGVDLFDIAALSPTAIQINYMPDIMWGSWPWASIITGWSEVRIITANGSMTLWVQGQALLEDFNGNAKLQGSYLDDTLTGSASANTLAGEGGNDTLIGLGGADTLIGGYGNDVFKGTAADLNGDQADFSAGDRIVITDASLATFTFSLTGTTLTYTGGAISFDAPVTGTLVTRAAAGGGVELAVRNQIVNDIDGNRQSDFLLRDSSSGWTGNWLSRSNGAFSDNGSTGAYKFGSDWHIVGRGDFDGDGNSDILLRSDGGWLTNWLGRPYGDIANNGANTSLFFTTDWKVAGNGDFNGDGRADLLLRRDDGWLTNWLGTASGSFTNNGANTSLFFTTDWKIASTGDFNGDGYTDILLRRDDGWVTNWLGNSSGGFTNNGANTALFFTTDWKVIGTGDINGDGKDDLILRRDDGWITDWLGTATGGFTNNGANTALFLTTDWKISSIADFNGDGREDILLRNDSGWITDWLGTATGSFANNGANFSAFIASNWVVQDPFL